MSTKYISVDDSDNEVIETNEPRRESAKESGHEFCKELCCDICVELFNNINSKPLALVPCGHTFCSTCVDKFDNKCCPTCKTYFTAHVFNWTVIGLLPKPSLSKLKAQAEKLLEENMKLLASMDELNRDGCIEKTRKAIEARYSEVVNDLIMEKNNLIIKLASYERRIGLDRVLKEKAESEMRAFQAELAAPEQNGAKLENMLKDLHTQNTSLKENVNKLNRLVADPKALTFKPKLNRVDLLIGDIVSDNQSLFSLDHSLEAFTESARSVRARNSNRLFYQGPSRLENMQTYILPSNTLSATDRHHLITRFGSRPRNFADSYQNL